MEQPQKKNPKGTNYVKIKNIFILEKVLLIQDFFHSLVRWLILVLVMFKSFDVSKKDNGLNHKSSNFAKRI